MVPIPIEIVNIILKRTNKIMGKDYYKVFLQAVDYNKNK